MHPGCRTNLQTIRLLSAFCRGGELHRNCILGSLGAFLIVLQEEVYVSISGGICLFVLVGFCPGPPPSLFLESITPGAAHRALRLQPRFGDKSLSHPRWIRIGTGTPPSCKIAAPSPETVLRIARLPSNDSTPSEKKCPQTSSVLLPSPRGTAAAGRSQRTAPGVSPSSLG